jgi:hypothetical protein
MDAAGVADEKRPEILSTLRSLRVRYPNETPARLFARAQKQGAPIPPSRCIHGVVRAECVACNPKIGPRWYFTTGDSLAHTTPICGALVNGRERAPVDVASTPPDWLEQCAQCAKPMVTRARAAAPSRSRARSAPPPRPAHLRLQRAANEPRDLSPSSPPAIGDRIDWGGFSGVVTNVTDRGVAFSVDGVTLTAPWGDRATLHKTS